MFGVINLLSLLGTKVPNHAQFQFRCFTPHNKWRIVSLVSALLQASKAHTHTHPKRTISYLLVNCVLTNLRQWNANRQLEIWCSFNPLRRTIWSLSEKRCGAGCSGGCSTKNCMVDEQSPRILSYWPVELQRDFAYLCVVCMRIFYGNFSLDRNRLKHGSIISLNVFEYEQFANEQAEWAPNAEATIQMTIK